jgi:iron complex transport system ATP-binding protein
MNTPRQSVKTVIHVERLSCWLGNKQVLREVTFAVQSGEYLTIIGPNGAGKTTLLRAIDGLHQGRQSGGIEIFGRPLGNYRRKTLAKLIGYVPQADSRSLPFTVEQFVLMGRYPYLSPFTTISRADRQAVADALAQTDTTAFAQRALDTLSGGERQRVFIAAALAQGAKVLLLDEPTTFLDYRHQRDIRGLLAQMNREAGVTILAVTHDLNAAALESHRVLALREGAVAFYGPPAELMQPAVLEGVFGAPFLLVEHPLARIPMIVPAAASG